jgi:2-polyprenyl-3-methyl-5-hydroxy-6-metoxy-1,4-benzoquinol methylase
MAESSICPFCAASGRIPWRPGGPEVLVCPSCGGGSLHPRPAPEDQASLYQEDYYSEETGGRFLGLAERLVVALKESRVRAIVRRTAGPGALLDVGCGRGDMLERFRLRGWEVTGTQISRTAAEAARRRGLRVLLGDLADLDLEGPFQVITLFHVLEHLPDPGDALARVRGLLAGDGLLVVEVPNFRTLGFRLLGRRDLCFDHPHHLHFLTPKALGALLARNGFTVASRSFLSLEYSPFTTLQNVLNLLPGSPNRLYRSLMGNREGRSLRRSPWTWIHVLLGGLLALPACLAALPGLLFPVGNTMRFYARTRISR